MRRIGLGRDVGVLILGLIAAERVEPQIFSSDATGGDARSCCVVTVVTDLSRSGSSTSTVTALTALAATEVAVKVV